MSGQGNHPHEGRVGEDQPADAAPRSGSGIGGLPAGYFRTALSRITDPAAAAAAGQGVPGVGGEGDCIACRVSGTLAMGGAAGYLFWHSTKVPKSHFAHRIALSTMGTGFAVLAVMRATTDHSPGQ